MTPSEALRAALKDRGVTQKKLAEHMGYKSHSALTNRLNAKISCDLLIELLDKLDYEIIVQPKTQGKRREGSMVLEPSGLPDGRSKK